MSDTSSTPSPAKKEVKKTKTAAKPAEHPSYNEMVVAAVTALKDRKGTSSAAIKKYISANYKVNEGSMNSYVNSAIKRSVSAGQLTQYKGSGVNGSFKLAEAAKAPKKDKPAKSPKKATPKKSAVKKTTAKSPAKKTAKSPAKKATKSPAKKAEQSKKKTPKKSPKKPAKSPAKKPVAKKAKKPTSAKKTASSK